MKLHNKVNKDELRQRLLASEEPRTTLSFYQYAKIEDPDLFRNQLYLALDEVGTFGRI